MATEPTSRVRWGWLLLLIVALGLMLALTVVAAGWTMNRLVVWLYYDGLHLYASPLTSWLYFDQLAFLLNVLLTIPVGLLGRLAFRRLPWWVAGLAVLVLSGCVEVAQLVLPLGREATWGDVVSNTIGGFAGALIGHWWVRRRPAHEPTGASSIDDSAGEASRPSDVG